MSLLSMFNFLSGTTVTEKNNTIIVEGIRTPVFVLDLQRRWRTNAVSQHIFKRIRRNYFEINSFFAPDLYYVIKTLIDDRKTRTNRSELKTILEQLETNTWLKNAFTKDYVSRLDMSALDNFLLTPLSHQEDFMKRYDEMTQRWRLNGYILGAAAGSGKTITNLMIGECLRADVIICVVPKNSVESVWKDTVDSVYVEPQKYWYSTSEKAIDPDARIYIAHYEQLDELVDFFRTNHKGKKFFIALDESHNFNDIKSRRTQLFIDLVAVTGATDVIWSSGTPLKAMGSEVIPILRTIDPQFTPNDEERFKKVFGLSTARALDILAHRLGYMMFRVEKTDIVKNEIFTYRVDVKVAGSERFTLAALKVELSKFVLERMGYYKSRMNEYVRDYLRCVDYYESTLTTAQQKQAYRNYRADADAMHRGYDPFAHKGLPESCNGFEKAYIIPALPKDLRDLFLECRSVYKYVSLKVKGEALGRILGRRRMECGLAVADGWKDFIATDLADDTKFETSLIEIVKNSTKKTVIFTSYVEVVDRVADIFKQNNAKPIKVYGATNHELPSLVRLFGKDETINPLIATFKSLSTAVPLVMANTAVLMNAPFRAHEYEQAIARVWRLGQTETVHIFNVYLDTGAEPNISTRSEEIMDWSAQMVEAMLGKSGAGSVSALEDLREDLAGNDWVCEDEPSEPKPIPALERFSW